ncbi:IPT/TIG domain-containing protein [Nocardia sp. NPDC046763]|uniref:IPT/TIG domain-containing protein n=1 Tax=Nocardia sp. NPDC046763 TaxID=3155256 RepID=UPI0033D4BCBE
MALITGMSPNQATTAGGTKITVTGSGLQGASELFFQDQNLARYPVVNYTVDSDSQITLYTPNTGGTMGSFDLMVMVMVNGKAANTPLVNTVVPDGDNLSTKGTGGGTAVKVQDSSNRIFVSDFDLGY